MRKRRRRWIARLAQCAPGFIAPALCSSNDCAGRSKRTRILRLLIL
jgi:hypothetical protein